MDGLEAVVIHHDRGCLPEERPYERRRPVEGDVVGGVNASIDNDHCEGRNLFRDIGYKPIGQRSLDCAQPRCIGLI